MIGASSGRLSGANPAFDATGAGAGFGADDAAWLVIAKIVIIIAANEATKAIRKGRNRGQNCRIVRDTLRWYPALQ